MARTTPSVGVMGVLALAALAPVWASAQAYGPYAPPRPPVYAYPTPYAETPTLRSACCVAPAGTAVAVQLTDAVGTREMKAGDAFALRLAAPLIIDGQVVLPAGAAGLGRVVQSSGPGLGGKGAKLVVAADYLSVGGVSIPLQGLQLAGTGKDQSLAASAASIGAGLIFMPLGLVGFAVRGGDIEIPAGAAASAKIAQTVALRPIAAATRQDYAQVRAVFGDAPATNGWVEVPPPPPGMGQVVFFRTPSLLGTGQWFNVRENGVALGKLTNGAYFIAPVTPGLHSFTATSEPEFKDRLTLRIDPGETYYVEGVMTKGLLIGAADLTPSDKTRFDAASGELAVAEMQASASSAAQAR
jgi:hypothetical protein